MTVIHVVLSTDPKGGKGGVATVVPVHLALLQTTGETIYIPTHRPVPIWGKFGPWMTSFARCLAVTLKGIGKKMLFHVHPGSGLCLIRMLLLCVFLRVLLRQRVFVYLHTPYFEDYLRHRFWKRIIGGLVKLSTRTIVLTDYARGLLDRQGLLGKVRVIPNPYSPEEYVTGPKRNDVCFVLAMGRIVHGKGFLETLRAFARLPEKYRLIVAGEGPLLGLLRDEAEKLHITDRVEWTGWVFGKAKRELLQRSHVFCLPSRVDSFGMSFVEAQCFDLPIVAFQHPPVMEVISPAQSVIVQSLDPQTLASAIVEADRLSSTTEAGAGAGRRWVEERFGLERIARGVTQEVNQIFDDA
jgi:glycosyltransferase involved in cell wall biosynthesis